MPTYRINEGEFEIPPNWIDRSANVFAVGNKLPLSLSLVITRDDLPTGKSLAEYADEKLDDFALSLQQFKMLERRQIEVAGAISLEAEFKWRSNIGPMHQRQTYIPFGDRRILVVTASAPHQMQDEHRAEVDTMIASLRIH